MSTEAQQAATNGQPVKTVNRRTFTERLADLSLEEKVAVVKELKTQIAAELATREAAAKSASELAKGI